MIELRNWKVLGLPPFGAAVMRIPETAIVACNHHLWIRRIYPNIMHIAMHSLKAADRGETLPTVLAQNQDPIRLKNTIWILRVDRQVRKIKRAPYHPLALVALFPGQAAVVGYKKRAIRRFDKTIDPLRARRRDCQRQPPVWFLGETFVFLRRNF